MLIIKTLEIENFRSFIDKTVIDFPESGAILIKGGYKDKAINSGSGKSSILLAISHALGFCSIPSTELKSWGSKGDLLVRLVIVDTQNQMNYTIIRNPKLSVFINDQKVLGSSEELETKISEILKTPLELAKSLTYREQRKPGNFLTLTDAKKKEFLVSILGLEMIENAVDELSLQLNSETAKKTQLESTISILESNISTNTVTEQNLMDADNQLKEAEKRIADINIDDQVKTNNQKISELKQELNKINTIKSQASQANYIINSIKSKVLTIKADIDVIKKNICPTCQREWMQGSDLINKKEEEIKKLINDMQQQITIVKTAENIQNSDIDIQNKINELSQLIGKLQGPKQDALNTLNTARMLRSQTQSQLNSKISSVNSLNEQKTALQKIYNDINILNHAVEILGRNGFLSVIFDELLVDIENRINIMIPEIPNIEMFSISCPSIKETKKGTVKKNISVDLYKNGQKIPIKSISGGQTSAIELLSDLAVSGSIRSRSGSPLGWIALDEAMEGLDIETKFHMIELLKRNNNGQIFIIDHSTEVREGFEKIIEVEYDGRKSRIK